MMNRCLLTELFCVRFSLWLVHPGASGVSFCPSAPHQSPVIANIIAQGHTHPRIALQLQLLRHQFVYGTRTLGRCDGGSPEISRRAAPTATTISPSYISSSQQMSHLRAAFHQRTANAQLDEHEQQPKRFKQLHRRDREASLPRRLCHLWTTRPWSRSTFATTSNLLEQYAATGAWSNGQATTS